MKYRHKGYRDSEKKDRERKKEPAPPRSPEQRQLRHMMERSATLVLRCYQCSVEARDVESLTGASTCPGCGAALHVCRNCAHFDAGARWECNAPIEQPVQDKTAANACPLFSANTVLDATGRRATAPAATSDGRALFENLFKKK